jgi:outer membrane protein, multidrug efflux system
MTPVDVGLALPVNRGRLTLLVALAMGLAGCGTAPDFKPYQPSLQPNFTSVEGTARSSEPAADFWLGFEDPELNRLVGLALVANADLRIAQASLAETRANSRNSIAQLYPTLGTGGGARRARERDMQGNESAMTNTTYTAGFDAVWEVEMFGRVAKDARILTQSNDAASMALLTAARQTVAAEVTRHYVELRGLQAQKLLAAESAERLDRSLKLFTARVDAGRATPLDVERIRVQLSTALAQIPMLDASIARARQRLAVLTGQPATAMAPALVEAKPLPAMRAMELSRVGTPASLLLRRPDVKAAEQQAWAAAARVGIARSQLLPRLTLSGSLGLNSGRLQDLGNAHTFIYNLGANMVWTLFDFGRRESAIDAASARSDAAIVNYEKVVLVALEETEDALTTYSQLQRQTERYFDASAAADKAARIARARLDAGATDALTFLNAEQEAIQARSRLVQSQAAAATAVVAVFKALAGGVAANS